MSASDTWYADFQARQRELDAAADKLITEMEAAGYTVKVTSDLQTNRVRVSRKDLAYSQATSATAGRYFAVKSAHDKWAKHREAVQP